MRLTNYLLILLLSIQAKAQELFIIVHGTWSNYETWHSYEGDFFTYLTQGARNLGHRVESFCWSGKHDHASRKKAGKKLAQKIKDLSETTAVNLVCHSHGGNVAIVASQELAKINHFQQPRIPTTIKTIYALGTPVDLEHYSPNMDSIETFYNFFSLGDHIQPLLGLYGRLYPAHGRLANIRATINKKDLLHSELHAPCIGRWLPYIHKKLTLDRKGSFEHFDFFSDGLIDFNHDLKKNPQYRIDKNRSFAYHIDTLEVLKTMPRDEQYRMYALLMHEDPSRTKHILDTTIWHTINLSDAWASSIQESED